MAEPDDTKASKSGYFGPVKRRMGTGNEPNGRTGMWTALILTIVANVAVVGFWTGTYSERINNMQMRLDEIPREIPPATVTTTLGLHGLRLESLERKCGDRWDSGSWDYGGGK